MNKTIKTENDKDLLSFVFGTDACSTCGASDHLAYECPDDVIF